MIGVDFILNVIVDAQKAGDRGCGRGRGESTPERLRTRANSRGGAHSGSGRRRLRSAPVVGPTDLNLYQAQKALENAAAAVRDDGIIVWVAECIEGFGNATFESWIREARQR